MGHRGASAYAPENTIAAFDLAFDLGAHAVEMDVQMAADGSLVLFHDPAPDLRDWSGAEVATLEEVLRRYPLGTNLLIEIKHPESSPGVEEDLAVLLERHGRLNDPGISVLSFSEASLARVKEIAPALPRVALFNPGEQPALIMSRLPTLLAQGTAAIGIEAASATRSLLRAAGHRGCGSYLYTVNEAAVAIRANALGATGLITDYPDRAVMATQDVVKAG